MEAIIRPKKIENIGRVFVRVLAKFARRVAGLLDLMGVGIKLIVLFVLNWLEAPKLTRQVEPGVPPEEVRPPERIFEQGPLVR